MKLENAEKLLLALTAALCVFLLGFYVGRSGTRETITVQSAGLALPKAETSTGEADTGDEAAASVLPEAASGQQGAPVNINTATAEELQTLPGIGEVLAARIIEFRTENGAFRLIDELMDVRGIGEAVFDGLKDQITVG